MGSSAPCLWIARAAVLSCAVAGCVPVLETPLSDDSDAPWLLPENSWPGSAPPDGLSGEGFAVGQVVPEFRLRDQEGAEVSLWQFYGDIIVIDVSTIWCAPCQDLARGVEATYQEYLEHGFMYVTVLPENVRRESPSQADLQAWAQGFGLTAPVLADPDKGWSAPIVPDAAYPGVLVVGRDMRVTARLRAPVTDEAVRAGVEALLD